MQCSFNMHSIFIQYTFNVLLIPEFLVLMGTIHSWWERSIRDGNDPISWWKRSKSYIIIHINTHVNITVHITRSMHIMIINAYILWESRSTCEWPIEPPMGLPLNRLLNRRPLNDHLNGTGNDPTNDPRKRLLNVNRLFTADFLIGGSLGCSTRMSVLCAAQQLCISHIHSSAL